MARISFASRSAKPGPHGEDFIPCETAGAPTLPDNSPLKFQAPHPRFLRVGFLNLAPKQKV